MHSFNIISQLKIFTFSTMLCIFNSVPSNHTKFSTNKS